MRLCPTLSFPGSESDGHTYSATVHSLSGNQNTHVHKLNFTETLAHLIIYFSALYEGRGSLRYMIYWMSPHPI